MTLKHEKREVLKEFKDVLAAEKTPDFGFIEGFKFEVNPDPKTYVHYAVFKINVPENIEKVTNEAVKTQIEPKIDQIRTLLAKACFFHDHKQKILVYQLVEG